MAGVKGRLREEFGGASGDPDPLSDGDETWYLNDKDGRGSSLSSETDLQPHVTPEALASHRHLFSTSRFGHLRSHSFTRDKAVG
ncbi:hypothetical protein IRJ41_017787 [Triplophysa rosa]|uniref:Uncharacterized protein n=1 Tax=Triplophysa rosa TaxID=992332 RepID=A0A9W7TKP7_TRIRA|nr:hypothetical protein IRJ41_017787 [Triplophysa rosa]